MPVKITMNNNRFQALEILFDRHAGARHYAHFQRDHQEQRSEILRHKDKYNK